jgi:hypothetical protein
MSVDISNLFNDMAQSAASVLGDEASAAQQGIMQVFQNNKDSMAELIEARANGDIDQEEFESELEREKLVMEAELITLEIIAKSAVQKAMNAAMDTLKSALVAAI